MRNSVVRTLDQIQEDEMGGAFSTNGEMRNAYKILVGNPEGKRPLDGVVGV
jgi:hypothetical protein